MCLEEAGVELALPHIHFPDAAYLVLDTNRWPCLLLLRKLCLLSVLLCKMVVRHHLICLLIHVSHTAGKAIITVLTKLSRQAHRFLDLRSFLVFH